jgi:hypothetical protein
MKKECKKNIIKCPAIVPAVQVLLFITAKIILVSILCISLFDFVKIFQTGDTQLLLNSSVSTAIICLFVVIIDFMTDALL